MRKGRGGGKECEAPTHLIEISELTHALRVTKNRHNRKVCSQEKQVASHHDDYALCKLLGWLDKEIKYTGMS